MRLPRRSLLFIALLAVSSCQPARQFDPATPRTVETNDKNSTDAELPFDFEWEDNLPSTAKISYPLVFISETNFPELWAKLPKLWNPPIPDSPDAEPANAADRRVVSIKVPLGLPDPTPFLPPNYSPTLAEWQLGRELFFDKSYLRPAKDQACATCHQPAHHFAGDLAIDGLDAPSLVNSLYNRHQFYDGRAVYLEEVIQRTLDDERETPANDGKRHVWGGVVRRLREDDHYRQRFHEVFGTEPTQSNLGRAVATFLRTLLSGDSVYDRAWAVLKKRDVKPNPGLQAIDFEAILKDGDLAGLQLKDQTKAVAALVLGRGAKLFYGTAECFHCHGGPLLTDQGFHNLGIGLERYQSNRDFERAGRFGPAPFGEKNRTLIGAFKTPSLRNVAQTAPYFHTGAEKSLEGVVRYHVTGGKWNPFLDPRLLEGGQAGGRGMRNLGLSDSDISDLVSFLRALDGTAIEDVMQTASKR